ncbi:MAG: extracellular solute-binding protein [Clostridiales bacterium]|jgi:putative aldouronate transport system substrate-binding protein|nr:extracellular solute-binding protein [Clostridiales bacterium]
MKALFLKRIARSLTILSLAAIVMSCAGGETQNNSGATTAQNTAAASEEITPVDPTAKYDPPITVSSVLIVDDTIKYKEGESYQDNDYIKAYADELGINIDYKWTVPDQQKAEKINAMIATNDLPDMFLVDMKQLQLLVNSPVETIIELGGLFDTYATELTKEIRPVADVAFGSATFGGKLMALPYNAVTGLDKTAVIWIRKDWLEKLNLEAPKTVDDLMAIADAFVTEDPDGNGTADTYGIAATNKIIDTFAGLDGLFFAYHAYPGTWVKAADGNLVYGSVQPETRTALLKLQEFFAKGYFDPEFGTKDSGKVAEYTSAGRIGIEMGMMWNPAWPLNSSRDNDPSANWVAYPLVSGDGEPALSAVDIPVSQYLVVNKKCENPEAAIKMLNLFYDKVYGPNAEPGKYWESDDGVQFFKYAVIMSEKLYQNLDMHLNIISSLDSGDVSKLTPMEKANFDKVSNVINGSDNSGDWSMLAIYGKESSFAVLNGYEKDNLYFYNGFYGAPTETMASKGSNLVKGATDLSKMENEVFTKIIMGAPIESFDTFVADWERLGGDQITEEVNQWAKEVSGE